MHIVYNNRFYKINLNSNENKYPLELMNTIC